MLSHKRALPHVRFNLTLPARTSANVVPSLVFFPICYISTSPPSSIKLSRVLWPSSEGLQLLCSVISHSLVFLGIFFQRCVVIFTLCHLLGDHDFIVKNVLRARLKYCRDIGACGDEMTELRRDTSNVTRTTRLIIPSDLKYP